MGAVSRASVTLDQVARVAGVSRATASRVLSGNSAVSAEARIAVERAASELGYILNRAARSLAAGQSVPVGRSQSIGIVILEPTSEFFGDPKFSRLLTGMGEELSVRNLQLVLFTPQSPADLSRLENYLAGGQVDAVVVLAHRDPGSVHSRIRTRGIPVVFGTQPLDGGGSSFVDVDDRAGGRMATQHLIEQGRRNIAHIAGPLHVRETHDRLQGFREATWQAGLRSDLVEHAESDRDGGEMAMARLLARPERIDAVFAATDAMATGALWALQVVGRRVPDDVAVIGFDDSPLAAATRPALSSVRQPFEEMGREMTRAVVSLLSDRQQGPRQVTLSPELAPRESTVSATD
jgi:DNA-binding LacI/PurR family transcriptional regulator